MIKVQAEISATAYKKLCARLKGLSKIALWKILDHYIFHKLEDGHVEELLAILDQVDTGSTSITAQTEELSKGLDVPTLADNGPRLQVAASLTDQDLERSKAFLDLLYDRVYFTYLAPELRKSNAERIISFAEVHKLPVQDIWRLVSEGGKA